ncbi:MAG: hypothetical protein HOH08_08300 [Gammaproteobacteria bacterium]|nr:hypothetical protein [Gammaproteobacteria bacterium]
MILFLDGKVFNSRMDGSTSVDDLLTKVKLLLTSHNTISIASTQEKKVSAASVFYVSDTNLNIYFLSFDKSTHSKNIFKNRNIAATINKDVEDWSDIKGLQIKGYSEKLDMHQREEVLNRYKRKFKYLDQIINAPKNSNEQKIAEQFQTISVFVFTPIFLRLIDNSLGFGKKMELTRANGEWLRTS